MTDDTLRVGLHKPTRPVVSAVSEWSDTYFLDGRGITVRPIRPDDVDRLRRLFYRLSPETVLRRFFQPVKQPSERMLHHFAEVDHDRREAIVAEIDNEIVGVARFDRVDDRTHAEVAILVEDAWQGRGLGKLLLRRLSSDAVDHGVEVLTAIVLGDNRPALHLMHRVAPVVHTHLDHGEWYVDMPLVGPELRSA